MTRVARDITVAVDARALHSSGIGRYLRELLGIWLRDASFDRLTLLGEPDVLRPFIAERESAMRVDIVPHRGTAYSPVGQWSWVAGGRGAAAQADVTFFPNWDAPAVGLPRRSVVTVHDLTPFRVPDAFGAARRAGGRVLLRRVLSRAARVVCVSQAAAADVRADFPALTSPIDVVPNGVDPRFGEPAGPPPVAGPYLLWVGNLKPHKNPTAALDVLARARAAGWPGLRLVCVGRAFPELELADLAAARGLGDAVLALGEADDATLCALYAGCVALVFPSRAEGFGLPVLEAMTAGAPVIASGLPALREVVGDAWPLHAPDDVDSMARAVTQLLSSPEARAAGIARGRARAAHFSWTASAGRTAAIFRDVAGPSRAERGRIGAAHRAAVG